VGEYFRAKEWLQNKEKTKNKNQPNKNQKKKRTTRLNEKGEKREQHEFGDNLCFFFCRQIVYKNILTLLENYIIGLSNIQQKKKG
jgi:hypothetical protein